MSLPTTPSSSSPSPNSPFSEKLSQLTIYRVALQRRYQKLLDDSNPHLLYRWIFTFVLLFTYLFRVYMISGYYIVTYALGIYELNLLLGFLAPQTDPETDTEGPALP